MGYQTPLFILFAFAVCLAYYLVRPKFQKYIIFLANAVFLLSQGIKYLPFVLVTLLASYLCAYFMRKVYDEEKDALSKVEDPKKKPEIKALYKKKAGRLLAVSLTVSIGLLAVCKYSGFVTENINYIASKFGSFEIPIFRMILPVGISFYTFMAIGYVLDVYWKRYEAEHNFINYANFLIYFPHLVQGPIERFDEINNQTKDGIKFDYNNLRHGVELMLWGLFKKLVVADRLDIFTASIYDNYQDYKGVILIIATVVYAIELYADFSGCIDIVSGISEMLGIKLRKNFNHPYFSKDIPEFWRRWHISLCEWFKDYVYLPVSTSGLVKKLKKHYKSKNKLKAMNLVSTCIPTVVVWTITGLWHGADWKFVAWGFYYAVLMVLGLIFKDFNKKLISVLQINENTFSFTAFQIVKTFILTCAGRVFFRAASLSAALTIFKQMFADFGLKYLKTKALLDYGLDKPNYIVAALGVLVILVVDILQEHTSLRKKFDEENALFKMIVVVLGVLTILVFGKYGPGFEAANFVYEQF